MQTTSVVPSTLLLRQYNILTVNILNVLMIGVETYNCDIFNEYFICQ
jgi:hypothetical protein